MQMQAYKPTRLSHVTNDPPLSFSNVISHCIILEFIVNFFRMWNLKNPMISILTVAPYFTENCTSTGLFFFHDIKTISEKFS